MESEIKKSKTRSPKMDITSSSAARRMHHSSKVLIVSSIVLIVLAALLIVMRIKQKRAYDAYMQTPEGQLWQLHQLSQPVTQTPDERVQELAILKATSKPTTTTDQERISTLQKLEQ